MDSGWLERNPVDLVGIPRQPRKEDVDVWSRKEVEAIVGWFRTKCTSDQAPWYALFFEWLSLCSMRPSEALRMGRRHVENDRLRTPVTKTGKSRFIPLEQSAMLEESHPKRAAWQKDLRRILLELDRLYTEKRSELMENPRVRWKDKHLWPMNNLDKMNAQFRQAKKDLGLRNGRIYDLRATAEDYWVWELGLGLRTICAYAGHSVATYINYYERRYGTDEHTKLVHT